MEKSVMEKINQVIFMPGVKHVDILPENNQVWFSVNGKNETLDVVTHLEEIFSVNSSDYSEFEAYKKYNRFYFALSAGDLIITVNGSPKEEAPADTEAEENTTPDYTTSSSSLEDNTPEELALHKELFGENIDYPEILRREA